MSEVEKHVKYLLLNALKVDIINDYNVEIVGTSEKGDGYVGDIYFVNLVPKKSDLKLYHLVLKSGKSSKSLRATAPVKQSFENEIYIYNVPLPAFKKFQLKRGLHDIFDNYPKCYGTFTCPDMEVLVLENLKSKGFDLWEKTKPLPRKFLEFTLQRYGKLHAISAAMQDQEPETFKEICANVKDMWAEFTSQTDFTKLCAKPIYEALNICEKELDENSYNKWKKFGDETDYNVKNLRKFNKSLTVLTHGDCWNNNFLFKEEANAINVAFLDWQISGITSPVIDVSYFLYSCISKKDLEDFDELLRIYHGSFSEHLKNLGSDPEKLYPFSKFWDDWKIVGRFGIMMAPLIVSVILVEKDCTPDLSEGAEKGKGISEVMTVAIKNRDGFKLRIKPIIDHAVELSII